MRKFIALLLLSPLLSWAAETGYRLDHSPHQPTDQASLQAGARTFVNYCLGCHGVQYMRYGGLRDLGLNDAQIRDNLMFTSDKVGEPMRSPMGAKQGKQWFGVPPPDLSVISRVRGADWLYSYLRTFYRDQKTASGWNNAVFPNVSMPHALWTLQGQRAYLPAEKKWTELSKGAQTAADYDATVRDLVNFLVYVGEPAATTRKSVGIIVLFALGVLFIFAYLLKKEYWKDVK